MDGIGLAGCYAPPSAKLGPRPFSNRLIRRVPDCPPQGNSPGNSTKNSLYEAFPVLPVNRVFLAPACIRSGCSVLRGRIGRPDRYYKYD